MKQKYFYFLLLTFFSFFSFSQNGTHLHFDGNQDKALTYVNELSNYTIELWIKPTDLSGERDVFSSEVNGRRFWLDNGILKAGITSSPSTILQDNVVLPLNTWTHIALTVDEDNLKTKMFKNGELIDTNDLTIPLLGGNHYIGAKNNPDVITFSGEMEELRIWQKVLTQGEIIARRFCELRGNEQGLYQYFKFNQGNANINNASETLLFDSVSSSNIGGLLSFTLNGNVSNWIDGSPVISGISNPNSPTTSNLIEYNVGDIPTVLSATVGMDGTGLLWYTSNLDLGTTTAITPDTSNPGTYNYWVSSTNLNGCESERVKITVKVNPTINYGCWKAVDTSSHTLAIAENGTLWSWGTNSSGELGQGDNLTRSVPTQVGVDTNWESIVTCYAHSLAIKKDGTLWSWGSNSNGQLGQGDTNNRNLPTQVGTDTDWLKIGRGVYSTLAIKQNGTLWVAGRNTNGELGLNDYNDRNIMTQVGIETDWEEVSNNTFVSLAIKDNGTLWASGMSLHNGMDNSVTNFTQVNTETNWNKVYCGARNSYVLKTDGSLWSSGYNDLGSLGRPNTGDNYFHLVTGGSNWSMVAPGFRYVLGIKNDGTLWGWGGLAKSIFGLNQGNIYNPNQIGTEYNWKSVYTTFTNAIALKENNSAWLGKNTIFSKVSCPCDQITTWDGLSWSNGLPTSNSQVIFNGDYFGNGFSACSIIVNGTSVVVIDSYESVQVENEINVGTNATFEFLNNANLVQIENNLNVGNVIIHRESAPMIRQDYTAWSSPVTGQNLLNFSPQTLINRFYTYEPLGNTTATAWLPVSDPSTTNFDTGNGYLIRVANNWSPSIHTAYEGIFTGVPNNGLITKSIQSGYNLIGNPYASPINASQFIQENNSLINGSIYFWTHTVSASGGVYSVNNYASYSLAGGVAAAAGGSKPSNFIQVGQGFFIEANSSGDINFNNNMRQIQSSNLFFKNAEPKVDRFWLNLKNASNSYNQILVAYMNEATNNFDNGIDAKLFTNSPSYISSIVNNLDFVIQGRPTFTINDEVPLKIVINESDNYTISLDSFDGLFINQDIYLWDKDLNIYHDIKQSDYSFNILAGTYDDRFSILYKNTSLSNEEFESQEQVSIFMNNSNQIVIKNYGGLIDNVEVFDLTGRLLYAKSNCGNSELILENNFSTNVLLIRTKTTLNKVVTRKLIIK